MLKLLSAGVPIPSGTNALLLSEKIPIYIFFLGRFRGTVSDLPLLTDSKVRLFGIDVSRALKVLRKSESFLFKYGRLVGYLTIGFNFAQFLSILCFYGRLFGFGMLMR